MHDRYKEARWVMAIGYLGFAAAICGGDLLIKDYVRENIAERSRKSLAGNRIILTKFFNKGAMLGAMSDNPELLKGMTIFGVGSLAGVRTENDIKKRPARRQAFFYVV